MIIYLRNFMEIRVGRNNIQIKDSYEVSKKRFDDIIKRLRMNLPEHPVLLKRNNGSIKKEWAIHNLLYKLGIARSHTRDLNINYPLRNIWKIIYNIFGTFCIWLIP